jgi:hypothetical protein
LFTEVGVSAVPLPPPPQAVNIVAMVANVSVAMRMLAPGNLIDLIILMGAVECSVAVEYRFDTF